MAEMGSTLNKSVKPSVPSMAAKLRKASTTPAKADLAKYLPMDHNPRMRDPKARRNRANLAIAILIPR